MHNCDDNATCTNELGSFVCACNAGYSGNGVTCTDKDECDLGTDNCHDNAACSNEPGMFECSCLSGYSGNGVTCTDVNECDLGTHTCDDNATCTNEQGTFECACNAGWTSTDGGVTCTDVDECMANTDNCDANAACDNTAGGFACACNPGYVGNGVRCCPEGMSLVTGAEYCNAPPVIFDVVLKNYVFDAAQTGKYLEADVFFSDEHFPTNATDIGNHFASLDWGCDGAFEDVPQADTMQHPAVDGMGQLSIQYFIPDDTFSGVFPICVRVLDSSDLPPSPQAEMRADEYAVLFVRDDAKVTGGGWFESPPPAGVTYPDTSPALKASFGFMSQYEQEEGTTHGNFKLNIKPQKEIGKGKGKKDEDDLDFEFKSSSQEWLVVPTLHLAKFKGEGYLKDDKAKMYKYIVTLQDWAYKKDDDEDDKLRIKIWDEQAGQEPLVIYDNHLGVADTAWDATPLAKGKVTVFAPEGKPEYLVKGGQNLGDSMEGTAEGGSGALASIAIFASVCLLAVVAAAIAYRRLTRARRLARAGPGEHVPNTKTQVWSEFQFLGSECGSPLAQARAGGASLLARSRTESSETENGIWNMDRVLLTRSASQQNLLSTQSVPDEKEDDGFTFIS
eukprot:3940603-Rhodomonas_salina.2